MRLVLVRHGATAWSAAGRHTGRTDLPLTDLGRAEARAAAPTLHEVVGGTAALSEARVMSSPLRRASDTCRIMTGVEHPELADELVEFDYGDDEGRTRPEILADRPEWLIWRDGCPGGESVADVVARVDRFLARIAGDERTVVAVTHGHLLRFLAVRALGLDVLVGHQLLAGTASVSLLDDETGVTAVRLWNRTTLPAPGSAEPGSAQPGDVP
jgi:probable phosphoglycerate mutase